jgi:signal peptidase II
MSLVARIAAVVLILDQASKYLVVHLLRLDARGAIDVVPPFLNLRMAWNQGINFGLLSSSAEVMRWVLVVVALAISAWVWIWTRREPHDRRVAISAGLLIGGALGNVIDRLLYGAVADFFHFHVGSFSWYVFNLADVAIVAGVALLLYDSLLAGGGKAQDATRDA